jgi:hypothetical protein
MNGPNVDSAAGRDDYELDELLVTARNLGLETLSILTDANRGSAAISQPQESRSPPQC